MTFEYSGPLIIPLAFLAWPFVGAIVGAAIRAIRTWIRGGGDRDEG